jgi:hypothetical protein
MTNQQVDAREHRRRAQALHVEGRIEDAHGGRRRVLVFEPDDVDAWSYLWTTGDFTREVACVN